jgi:hypothetical protein
MLGSFCRTAKRTTAPARPLPRAQSVWPLTSADHVASQSVPKPLSPGSASGLARERRKASGERHDGQGGAEVEIVPSEAGKEAGGLPSKLQEAVGAPPWERKAPAEGSSVIRVGGGWPVAVDRPTGSCFVRRSRKRPARQRSSCSASLAGDGTEAIGTPAVLRAVLTTTSLPPLPSRAWSAVNVRSQRTRQDRWKRCW